MSAARVAGRYAQALVEAAAARGLLDRVEADLQMVVDWWQMTEVRRFLSEVRIPSARKEEVLARVGQGGGLDPLTIRFWQLLVAKQRYRLLPGVLAAYRQRADQVRRRIRAEVHTASALSPQELDLLRQRLEVYLGRVVTLRPVIDPSLLGGVRIQAEDLIIDGSVNARLRQLERRLLRAAWPAGVLPNRSAAGAPGPATPAPTTVDDDHDGQGGGL